MTKVADNERITQLRWIVSHHQFADVDGQPVDWFTANSVIQVYDAMETPAAKMLFSSMHVTKMIGITWRLLEKLAN